MRLLAAIALVLKATLEWHQSVMELLHLSQLWHLLLKMAMWQRVRTHADHQGSMLLKKTQQGN